MNKHRLFYGLALAASVALGTSGAHAQSASLLRYAPPVVRVDANGKVTTNDAGVERTEQDRAKVLVPQLKGLVFVDKPGAVKKRGARASGLVVSAAADSVPAEAREVADRYLGGAVTLGALDDLTREIVKAYRSADRPVVNVVVPEQEITNGVIQILVVVGRLGNVRVEGASGPAAEALIGEIGLVKGQPISEGQLTDDLRFLNRSPFRHVDALYQPGKAYGQTDVVLQDVEDKPWTAYAGVGSNGGNGPLGDPRPYAGAMEHNQLGLGETLGYQYTTDERFYRLQSHMISLDLPLPDRWEFQAIGGYTGTRASLQGGALNQTGSNTMFGGYFTAPLPHMGSWAQNFRFGAEYKASNNNLDYGGTTVVAGRPEIFQGVLGYSAEGLVFGTKTKVDVSLYGAPGHIGPADNNALFQTLRANASADYVYAKAHIDNRWEMPEGWRLLSSVNSQISSTNLLPTEAFILGGIGSVRGFAFQDALVDSGVTANFTLYTPGVQVIRNIFAPTGGVNDELRGYVFFDHGSGWFHTPNANQAQYVGLTGTGVGVSYEAAKYLTFDVGYGWHVSEIGLKDGETGRWHFSAVARF